MPRRAKSNDDNHIRRNVNSADVEASKWRSQVTADLKALKKRLDELELHTVQHRESVKLLRITSFAESQKDNCCGLVTWAQLVRTSWASRLQCILLMIATIAFGFCALSYFFEARRNELAVWKPIKIDQTIEYGNSEAEYQMPYVYIAFQVTQKDSSSDSMINETLAGIGNAMSYRSNKCSIRYFSHQKRNVVGCEWSLARYEGRPSSSFRFWGYLKIRLDNPTPGNGSFAYSIDLAASDMIFSDSIEVGGFWVSISRDEEPADFSYFIYLDADQPLSNGTSLSYTVDYSEKAVDDNHYFTNSIAWSSELSADGMFRISARPNLRVEYWTEYVAFGYSDWIFGMGGLYNFFAIGFFYTAYYAADRCNDNWSMGILPRFSFIFSNLEMVLWLKHKTLSLYGEKKM